MPRSVSLWWIGYFLYLKRVELLSTQSNSARSSISILFSATQSEKVSRI